jgi:hypothetical protein
MINTNIIKREYTTPVVDIVILDNEISLVLATNPPAGPGENNQENKDLNSESPWE